MQIESERFWSKVEKTPSCWLWTASVNGWGYGRFVTGGKIHHREWMAHKYAYETLRGPLSPDRPTLDHICRVRRCVNPGHLEPVTPRVNNLRGIGAPAINSRKQACPKGHPYSPENTWTSSVGWRQCKACGRAHNSTEAVLARRRAGHVEARHKAVGDGYIRIKEAAVILGLKHDTMRQPEVKARLGIVKIMGWLYVPRENIPG